MIKSNVCCLHSFPYGFHRIIVGDHYPDISQIECFRRVYRVLWYRGLGVVDISDILSWSDCWQFLVSDLRVNNQWLMKLLIFGRLKTISSHENIRIFLLCWPILWVNPEVWLGLRKQSLPRVRMPENCLGLQLRTDWHVFKDCLWWRFRIFFLFWLILNRLHIRLRLVQCQRCGNRTLPNPKETWLRCCCIPLCCFFLSFRAQTQRWCHHISLLCQRLQTGSKPFVLRASPQLLRLRLQVSDHIGAILDLRIEKLRKRVELLADVLLLFIWRLYSFGKFSDTLDSTQILFFIVLLHFVDLVYVCFMHLIDVLFESVDTLADPCSLYIVFFADFVTQPFIFLQHLDS